MIKVGISGRIAAGKSEVEKILQKLNYKVFDLDVISHSLFEKENIKNLILNEFKTIDRKEIGKIVFNDFDKKKKLENILYPELEKNILDLFEKNKKEFALQLLETKMETAQSAFFDKFNNEVEIKTFLQD